MRNKKLKTAQQELILANNGKIIMRSYCFARLLILTARPQTLAIRFKHRLNTWIHDVLTTKTSCSSLFFIENIIPRETGSPENLRHCICILQLSYGPSFPASAAIKIYQKQMKER